MTPITFQTPVLLYLLLLLIPLAVLLKRARDRRNLVLTEMEADESLRRSDWPDRTRLVGVALLMLALARPGYHPQRHSVSKSGRDVVFALDVSQSMLAEDAYPSRLNAAKEGIRDSLDSFQTERVGLVIYAGSANILCPLTYDYDFVRYMLDQASTRAVDFGGTTLLSAVEKCTDSMLSVERKGMQDLVVLTDGEDHGPAHVRVAELLNEHALGLLVIGIGDGTSGSRIPIEDQDGNTVYLQHNDQTIMTRLNDQGLRELATRTEEAVYRPVGTAAFDLAEIYSKYVVNKPVSGTSGTETYVVYREAGFALIGIAVVLFLLAERQLARRNPRLRVLPQTISPIAGLPMPVLIVLACLGVGASLQAENRETEQQFSEAIRLQQRGQHADALEAYERLEFKTPDGGWLPRELATLKFNQGLCHLAEAAAMAASKPRTALTMARQAQSCFLAVKRMHPGLLRAGMRLDPTSRLIADYEARVREDDEREQALQDQMQQLIERLQELQRQQTDLRNDVPARTPQSEARRRGQANAAPATPISEPDTAAADSRRFSSSQRVLQTEGVAISELMRAIDQAMKLPEIDSQNQPLSVLQVPRRLMNEVIAAQDLAGKNIRQWSSWPDAREQQHVALQKLQQILDLLANNNSGESDESEWDDEEEDWDSMEPNESDESKTKSMSGRGDFANGAAMQPLPLPNYSVEDILEQETGNLQFRQQQRAKGNQNSVEKDW
jgi:hypothetical protein